MVPSLASFRSHSRRRTSPLPVLTPRETEVLRRIVAGQSTGQMADEMHIAINTLRSYVKNVLTKLGAHSRLQAAALAMREDLLSELSA
jgi:DNA-binding CsgD family transcriptional regulator